MGNYLKIAFGWLKNSWIGKKVIDVWRMFFNDDTGVSMRKVLAFKLSLVADYLIIKFTDKTNLEWVVAEVFLVMLTLLGIVVYDNYRTKKLTHEKESPAIPN